jgi:hypothetical protein
MKLKEFLKEYVCPNTMIRLWKNNYRERLHHLYNVWKVRTHRKKNKKG